MENRTSDDQRGPTGLRFIANHRAGLARQGSLAAAWRRPVVRLDTLGDV
jgi:hypothetical protein